MSNNAILKMMSTIVWIGERKIYDHAVRTVRRHLEHSLVSHNNKKESQEILYFHKTNTQVPNAVAVS